MSIKSVRANIKEVAKTAIEPIFIGYASVWYFLIVFLKPRVMKKVEPMIKKVSGRAKGFAKTMKSKLHK